MKENVISTLSVSNILIKLVCFLLVCLTSSPIAFAVDPNVVTGRVLEAGKKLGDDSDWLEIAKHENYSLVMRAKCLPVGGVPYYIYRSGYYGFLNSNVKEAVDSWFDSLSVACSFKERGGRQYSACKSRVLQEY